MKNRVFHLTHQFFFKKKIVLILLIYKLYENLIWRIFLKKFNNRGPKSSQTSHTVCLKNVFCTRDNLKINKNVWYFCQRDCIKLFLINCNNVLWCETYNFPHFASLGDNTIQDNIEIFILLAPFLDHNKVWLIVYWLDETLTVF